MRPIVNKHMDYKELTADLHVLRIVPPTFFAGKRHIFFSRYANISWKNSSRPDVNQLTESILPEMAMRAQSTGSVSWRR